MCVPIKDYGSCVKCPYSNNAHYLGNLLPISTVVLYVYVTYLGSTFEINMFGINDTYQFYMTYTVYFIVA